MNTTKKLFLALSLSMLSIPMTTLTMFKKAALANTAQNQQAMTNGANATPLPVAYGTSNFNLYTWAGFDAGISPASDMIINGVVTFSDGTTSASFQIEGEYTSNFTLPSTAVSTISLQISGNNNVLTFKPASGAPFNYSVDAYGYAQGTKISEQQTQAAYSSKAANLTLAEYTPAS